MFHITEKPYTELEPGDVFLSRDRGGVVTRTVVSVDHPLPMKGVTLTVAGVHKVDIHDERETPIEREFKIDAFGTATVIRYTP